MQQQGQGVGELQKKGREEGLLQEEPKEEQQGEGQEGGDKSCQRSHLNCLLVA
jgi:hypothetical protein